MLDLPICRRGMMTFLLQKTLKLHISMQTLTIRPVGLIAHLTDEIVFSFHFYLNRLIKADNLTAYRSA
jgi:hypothetical protein